MAAGDVRLDGPPSLVRSFPQWLGLSRYAPYAAELAELAAARTQPPDTIRLEAAAL